MHKAELEVVVQLFIAPDLPDLSTWLTRNDRATTQQVIAEQ
jgi:hypothetical protein